MKYFNIIKTIDQFFLLDQFSIKEFQKICKLIYKNKNLEHYFYSELKDATVFDPLYKSGHLSVTNEYIQQKSDSLFFYWPPIYYLQFLAKEGEHNKVWKVVSELPENDSIGFHVEITKLVNLLASDYRIVWMKRLNSWLLRVENMIISNPDPFRVMMRDLVNVDPNLALEFMKSYFRLKEDPNSKMRNENYLSPKPKPQISDYEYFESLKSLISPFLKCKNETRIDFFTFLCELLNQALGIEYPNTEEGEDRSYITRSSIMDDVQNYNHNISDKLVSIIRDVGEEISKSSKDDYKQIIRIISERKWILFERLYLYFIRLYGLLYEFEDTMNRILPILGNYIDRIEFKNEVYFILNDIFPKLNRSDQTLVLETIKQSAEKSQKKWIQNYGESKENDLIIPFASKDAYEEKLWTFLSAIQDNLNGEWKKEFDHLNEEYKKRDFPPQYASYHWSFVGPISPVDKTEIANMTIDDLLAYLRQYEPYESISGGHSREGLSRQLDQDVENNPQRYLDSYKKLLESKIHIGFHNGILYGLRKAISSKNIADFKLLVEYLYGLHAKYGHALGGENSDVQGLKDAILGIYRNLYGKFDQFEKSARNLELVRNIFPYLEDSSPDADYDKANDDPIHTGINSVRGKTLHALFKCILWLVVENEQWKEDRFSEPIIDEILERVREHFINSSYKDFDTDRSVMGEYLRFIYRIRKDWFEENLNRILPEDNKKVGLVTFFTYIQRGGFSESLYKTIKPWYEYVLKDLSNLELEINFDKGLKPYAIAEHIMMIYAYELEPIEPGGLVELFFENASNFMKGNAIRFIGTKIPKEENYIRLARALWEWRVVNGSLSSQELDGFLEWWAEDKFENEWIFQYLYLYKNSEEISVSEFQIFKLFEILDENFTKDPKLVIEIIDSYSQSNRYHLHPRKDQSLWSILKKGLAVEDLTVRGMTEDIVHRLGSFGYLEYRELLGL